MYICIHIYVYTYTYTHNSQITINLTLVTFCQPSSSKCDFGKKRATLTFGLAHTIHGGISYPYYSYFSSFDLYYSCIFLFDQIKRDVRKTG